MNHVLIVAYYFPPIGGIGSIRMAGFASYLPTFGWLPTVLAPAETPHPRDDQLRYPENAVVRSRSFELSRLGALGTRPASHEATVGGQFRGSGRLRGVARRLVFPDAQIGWYPGAVSSGFQALRRDRYDAVYSSSFPITAHLIAGTLSRAVGLPWIAEFRDPWSDRLRSRPQRRLAAAVERSIAARATRLIMPSPSFAECFGVRWGREVAVVPNGCDELPAPVREDRATLAHLGTYYPGHQRLTGLWEAVRRMLVDSPGAVARIRFIGELPDEGRAEVARCGLQDLVTETGRIPHDQAMRLTASSSLLFSGGESARDPIARGVIPAKLFEYLATDRPILYLGDPAGDAAALLEGQPGCWVIDPDDIAGITEAIKRGLEGAPYRRDASGFSRRSAAGALAQVLNEARLARPPDARHGRR